MQRSSVATGGVSLMRSLLAKWREGMEFEAFGADALSAQALRCIPVLVSVAARLRVPIMVPVRIRYAGSVCRIAFASVSDCAIFREVFIEREYVLPDGAAPTTIVDLGSNVGITVAFWKLTYPSARVYAVEPDPSSFSRLSKLICQWPDVFAYPYAISDQDGEASFFSYPRESFSSALVRRRAGGREVRVPTRSLSSFLDEAGVRKVDLMKFDVEGAEELVFSDPGVLGRISSLIGEVHEDLMHVDANEFLARFSSFRLHSGRLSGRRFLLYAAK